VDNNTKNSFKNISRRVGGSRAKQPTLPDPDPPSPVEGEKIFSSQSQEMDYITLRGIESRTGIEKENAYTFVIKELLDNAVDSLETNRSSIPKVKVTLSTKLTKQGRKFLCVAVGNNFDGNEPAFTKQRLESIFNTKRYYSSKRNQFKISRGALGDALKEVLCIPYALAREEGGGIADWDEPLIIRSKGKTFHVYLIVNRVKQTFRSKVIEVNNGNGGSCSNSSSNDTEVEVHIPIFASTLNYYSLFHYLTEYALFNTHIEFSLLDDDYGRRERLPQGQSINMKWKNQTNIGCYSREEFHDLILGLENNEQQIYSVIDKIPFREVSNLKKVPATLVTVGEIKHSSERIDELYDLLRSSMPPASSLALPFDATKRTREKALKERLERVFGYISDMKYKSTFGLCKHGNDDVRFPFFFEIAIAKINSLRSDLKVIESLNSSLTPGRWIVFGGEDFSWQTPGSRYTYTSNNIFDIFKHYGYSRDEKVCKKPNSLILVNLISQRIDYKSYGKSRISFSPFANTIAETTVKACIGGGRSSDGKPDKRSVLMEILEERKSKWFTLDEISRQKHWWTQSDVFYATRKHLIEYGYPNEEINRDYITQIIKDVCENELGVKREEIGIIAADRAQLYFKGQWMNVGLAEIEELIQYGTDILIIEKEGIAEQLSLFADEKGIALLNTRGFLVEYASVLAKKSEKEGCNISILTDLDASGLVLARDVPNAFRIGIDFETLKYLGLELDEKIEEKYEPGNHLKPLEYPSGKHAGVYPNEIVDYVAEKRVEINSVITAVDDNKKFWNWIESKLRERFAKRDLNRSVNIRDYVAPECLEKLNDIMKQLGTVILKPHRDKVKKRLSNFGPGFLFDRTNNILPGYNIDKYEDAISEQSRKIIENNPKIKSLIEKIQDIVVTNDSTDNVGKGTDDGL